ncbi:MAG: alpha/beta hydrolase [Candidatus Bathyarchaeota archaeon]|nr:MAG: alpha/beta hydrolase [Candidatus Bathyarchaeota archaeon]
MDNTTTVILTLSALVILIICTIVVVKFRKTIANHYSRLDSIPSHVYHSKHGDIEYLLRGDGSTILVSHGITGGVDQGIGLSEDFLGFGNRRLFISRFGYLKSSMPDTPSPELQADVYKELIDYLGIKRVFIFGNSAGATSAIHFAIRYPQNCSGLILLSSNAPLDNPSGHPPKFVFQSNFVYWFVMKLVGKSMMTMFVPKAILDSLPKQELNRIIEGVYFSALPVTKRTEGIVFDLSISNPSINNDVPFERIRSPTLIINAIDDPATLIEGARTLARNIPHSKLMTFDTGGHLLLGQEEEIRHHITKFINVHA